MNYPYWTEGGHILNIDWDGNCLWSSFHVWHFQIFFTMSLVRLTIAKLEKMNINGDLRWASLWNLGVCSSVIFFLNWIVVRDAEVHHAWCEQQRMVVQLLKEALWKKKKPETKTAQSKGLFLMRFSLTFTLHFNPFWMTKPEGDSTLNVPFELII